MVDLINRCWLPDPADRPSFDIILLDFQSEQFDIFPDALSSEIRDFCEAILEWEHLAGCAHGPEVQD
jgi:hypothetical protein